MNFKPTIPVVTLTGPGSQPEEDDFRYIPVPSVVDAFAMPLLPEGAPAAQRDVARRVLTQLLGDLRNYDGALTGYPVYSLSGEEQAACGVLNEIFAEGEVSARVLLPGGGELSIQETRFAGVWRVMEYRDDRRLIDDRIEICPIPAAVWQSRPDMADLSLPDADPSMMNGRWIAGELAARVAAPAREPHIINLTLLPVNEADRAYLDHWLGEGNSAVFSRGYGKCRVLGTRLPEVWRINYFNENNTLLQDMIEIGRVPEIVLAGAEDFADAAQHIAEVLEWFDREDAQRAGKRHERRECPVCWWIYDPQQGDELWQVAPGVPFSALPEYWRCPNCDCEKSRFLVLGDDRA